MIKDLFGVSGKELQEIRAAIASLQLGELIIKNQEMVGLGMTGKKYKKIRVSHLIRQDETKQGEPYARPAYVYIAHSYFRAFPNTWKL